MNALIAVFVLLMSGVINAQDAHSKQSSTNAQCVAILKVDSISDANTRNETIDSLTVCDDGKGTAFHSFTAPAFGATQPEKTKWDYTGEIDKNALTDLKQIIRRMDIVRLPESVNAIKKPSPIDLLMRFRILDQGTERTITLHVPAIGCARPQLEISRAVWDLICVFSDLYERVKTGSPPDENSCGCKSLHEMAIAPDTGGR